MKAFVPPQSKSDAQRALVLARIIGAPAPVVDPVPPSDVAALKAGLEVIERGGGEIDCGDGGAPFRFLLGQAAVRSKVPVKLYGTERLAERPHAALAEALPGVNLAPKSKGARVLIAEVRPVDRLPSAFTVSTDESSQFASSILLAAAAIAHRSAKPCKVRLEGARASEGYLQMTVRWMQAVGFDVSTELTVTWKAARPLPPIPGDWSSIGYLLLFAWTCGGRVLNLSNPALHPDGGLIDALASVGLAVAADGSVTGALRGQLEVSAKPFPDSIPTLVALACVLPGVSRFTECGILRGKESDRLDACAALARAAAATAVIDGETLSITPGAVPPLRFDSRGDHRMAMSAAVLAALGKVPLALKGAQAVRKSFPAFWTEALKAGVEAEVLA